MWPCLSATTAWWGRNMCPGKPVNTPARVRYTAQTEYIFLRGKQDEHSKVSRQLLEVQDAFCNHVQHW